MTFENGASAVLNMNGFSDKMFRECHIVGTKGELIGYGTKLKMNIFDATVISHDIALAAEESRKNGGATVLLEN